MAYRLSYQQMLGGLRRKLIRFERIAEFRNVSMICVTKTWLSSNMRDSIVAIPGYNLFRKDRVTTIGGGVCIYSNSKIPCKRLEQCNKD